MTELEFFTRYEIRPSRAAPGRVVEIWQRGADHYTKCFGAIRLLDDGTFQVRDAHRDRERRRSFDGAFKLIRTYLSD